MSLIEVKDLYKIFGANPKKVLPLISKGMTKQEIKKNTGCTVAINGASFNIEAKRNFCCYGVVGKRKVYFYQVLKPAHQTDIRKDSG